MTSTIAAISTPLGAGGIGVIRISGPEAVAVAEKIFSPAKNRQLADLAGYSALYGRLHDEESDFDEAVATVFRAPHSSTTSSPV